MRRNAVASLLGQGWSAGMALVFVPAYLRILGVEAWGLIGLMITLQAWFALLDVGLSPALAREAARLRAGAATARSVRNLLRALEILLGVAAIIVAGLMVALAGWIVTSWIVVEALSRDEVELAIQLSGFVIGARLFEQVHRSVLQGLTAQVTLNLILAGTSTVRWGGAFATIAYWSPTVTAFFAWQALVSLLSPSVVAMAAYACLPKATGPTVVGWSELSQIKRFVSGLAAATTLGVAMAQADKVFLSGMVPLNEFGLYMLASTVATALYYIVSPIVSTVQSYFSISTARGDLNQLSEIYKQTYKWLVFGVLPFGLLLVAFPHSILMVWTRNPGVSSNAAHLLQVLAAGTTLNAFSNPSIMLHVAYGVTGPLVIANATLLLMAVSGILLLVPVWGIQYASYQWLALNVCLIIWMSASGARLNRKKRTYTN